MFFNSFALITVGNSHAVKASNNKSNENKSKCENITIGDSNNINNDSDMKRIGVMDYSVPQNNCIGIVATHLL